MQIDDEMVEKAADEMARQDITFANCDRTWQRRTIRAALEAALSAAEPVKTPFKVASKHMPEAHVSLLSRAIRQGLEDYGWKNFGMIPEVLAGYIIQAERAEADMHPQQPAPSVAAKAKKPKLPPVSNELYEYYPSMSAQTHADAVKDYARSAVASALSAQVQDVAVLEAISKAAQEYVEAVSGEPEKDCWDTEDGKEAPGAEKFASDWAWKDYDDAKQKAFDNLRTKLSAAAPAKQEG